jgi:hypothetical protein
MDLLQISSANVSETIGKSLLDSLSLLSKDKSIESVSTSMENFGTAIADAILGMGVLIRKIVDLGNTTKINSVLSWLFTNTPVDLLIKAGKSERLKNTGRANRSFQGGQTSNDLYVLKKKEADAIKKTNAARAAELAALNKKSEIDKLKDKFDVERIGLMVALNAATDEETKLRIKAQLAILDNNEALAKKYNAELDSTKAINEFANAAVDAAKRIGNIDYTVPIGSPLVPTTPLSYMNNFPSPSIPSTPLTQAIGNIDYTVPISTGQSQYMTPMSYADVRLTVDTSSTADEFANLVARSIQLVNKTGISTGISGAN